MSTPAIRAMNELPLPLLLTLALLVARVLADDAHRAVAADHLALLTHLLDRRTDLHVILWLLVAVGHATPAEVVRSELDLHLVAGEDPDVVHPHLPGDVREDLVAVFELDTEHGVGERLDDRPLDEDRVVLGLGYGAPPGAGAREGRAG